MCSGLKMRPLACHGGLISIVPGWAGFKVEDVRSMYIYIANRTVVGGVVESAIVLVKDGFCGWRWAD